MSIALGQNSLDNVAKTFLDGDSSRRKTPRAIAEAILTNRVIAAEPDAPLLAPRETVDPVGESHNGGELDEGQQPWCALLGNVDFKPLPRTWQHSVIILRWAGR